jgi:hypothetical protein
MNNHENPHAFEWKLVPLLIGEVRTLELDEGILRRDQSQENGHPTAGYALALLTKDPSEAGTLLRHDMEPDEEGNYDLADVAPRSIMMWTPVQGGSPDYMAVVGVQPDELNYVQADSPEHAWVILGLNN